jgi:predicted molibdopterin-dependent oxidoreductase YjgC
VQRIQQVIPAPGEAKPGWRIFTECFVRAKSATPHFNAKEVMAEIVKAHPQFAPVDYENLDGEGVLLGGGQ